MRPVEADSRLIPPSVSAVPHHTLSCGVRSRLVKNRGMSGANCGVDQKGVYVNGVAIDEIVTTGYDSNCSEDYQLEAQ
jgi:hypothetical protein